jgi:UDP-GlcNAc:undecaprenyl-phosphate/decaprenyl-phosphate GlcNAc-1-phosphate transferase
MSSLMIVSLLSFCILSFSLTWLFVILCVFIARRFNILDIPDGVIKLHKIATPYLGGVAVFMGTIMPSLLVLPGQCEVYWTLTGLTSLLVVGLVDDVKVLSPLKKFIGQIVAVCCFLYAGLYIHPTICSHTVAILLSGFWMLTVINAFNLVDVMDGLACTLALCAAIGFFVLSVYLQHMLLAFIFIGFIGSLLAFLYHNRPQATIYLGDAGSLFIGGVLVALPFGLNLGKYTNLGYCAPIIILSIPLLELASLIIIRTYKKIPFYNGSPDHFSLYLQAKGWSKNSILLYCFSLMMPVNLIALLLVAQMLSLLSVLILSLLFLIIWFACLMLRR